jgi:aryl-alcohol dehydrogenase-like predicted oxidoreductase
MLGASKVDQIHENLKALEVMAQLTDDHKTRIGDIFG